MHLNVGNCFNPSQLDTIANLNSSCRDDSDMDRITELYGSTRELNAWGNARPMGRLPTILPNGLKSLVDRAHSLGLQINWTVNAPCVGRVENFLYNIKRDGFLLALKGAGVDRVTVAHPLIMELINASGFFPIEISTIMNVQHASQLIFLKKRFSHIDKLCVPIYKNRDFEWLMNMQEVAADIGVELELIVNEFCTVGGIPCEGLFRQACYCEMCHELYRITNEDNWPKHICTEERDKNPVSWLKAPFILPQSIEYYENLGITHFKVTGRTHPVNFINRLMGYYMKREVHGNLLKLWAHLQTIIAEDWESTQEEAIGGVYIDIDDIVARGFGIEFDCHGDCHFCTHCDKIAELMKRDGTFKETEDGCTD